MKKKLIVLNIGVILAIVVTFVYMLAAGGEYLLKPGAFFSNCTGISDAVMTCDTEGVVELKDAYLDGEALVIRFGAVGKGSTKGTISFHVNFSTADGIGFTEHSQSFSMSVNSLGMIIDETHGLNFSGYKVAIVSILFILLLTESITLWIYANAIRRGEFDYSMVSFGGTGIFALALFVFTVYKMLNNSVRTFTSFTWLALDIGTLLFIALVPVMLIMAVFMAFSNIWLMRHEGYRPANALGIIFAVLWFLGTVFLLGMELEILDLGISYAVRTCLVFVACYLECIFLATVASTFLATRFKVPYDKDYIIVLGCRIRKDGTLTPLLKGRVDRALAFEKAQYDKTGKHAVFVPSGGQGPDEIMPEGQAMENYLLEQGVPAERIKREDKSSNTLQNMSFSRAVIESDCGDISKKKIAFSTTNYHVFRGCVLAGNCGFKAQGLSAKTKAYFYPNAFLREFAGLLAEQKLRHIGYLAALILAIVLMYLGVR